MPDGWRWSLTAIWPHFRRSYVSPCFFALASPPSPCVADANTAKDCCFRTANRRDAPETPGLAPGLPSNGGFSKSFRRPGYRHCNGTFKGLFLETGGTPGPEAHFGDCEKGRMAGSPFADVGRCSPIRNRFWDRASSLLRVVLSVGGHDGNCQIGCCGPRFPFIRALPPRLKLPVLHARLRTDARPYGQHRG